MRHFRKQQQHPQLQDPRHVQALDRTAVLGDRGQAFVREELHLFQVDLLECRALLRELNDALVSQRVTAFEVDADELVAVRGDRAQSVVGQRDAHLEVELLEKDAALCHVLDGHVGKDAGRCWEIVEQDRLDISHVIANERNVLVGDPVALPKVDVVEAPRGSA